MFSKHGNNSAKAALFAKGESKLRREILIEAMTALVASLRLEETPVAVIAERMDAILPDSKYKETPENVKSFVAQIKQLYKEGQSMKSKLMLTIDRFDRGVLANQIRDNDELATRLLSEVDFFSVHGYLPSEDPLFKTVDQMTAGELYSRKAYLEPWVSRHKRKRSLDADVISAQVELDLIRKKLDADAV